MPTYQDILYATNDGVATITINRPSRLNAFNAHTLDELKEAFVNAAADHSVGVVVLTGVGDRAFSAGGDVNWEASGGLEGHNWHLGRQIVEHPKPVIARVSGYAIGGGNHLAYACDFTLAAEHSTFGQNGISGSFTLPPGPALTGFADESGQSLSKRKRPSST